MKTVPILRYYTMHSIIKIKTNKKIDDKKKKVKPSTFIEMM